jgi:protein-S-isoprenylcysteine O-methyltransferase Ste14
MLHHVILPVFATMVAMPMEGLRIAAFCVYLASWVVLAIAALAGAIPKRNGKPRTPDAMNAFAFVGIVLQSTAALPVSLSLSDGSLRPSTFELLATLVLAPFAVGLFSWSLWFVRKHASPDSIVTQGPYAWVRHPMYLAFFAMLLATGLLVSARLALLVSTILYMAGSELRMAAEEAALGNKFPNDYRDYQRKTRSRYLPGIR